MSSHQLEIIAIAVVTAMACVLPGVFLVLRRMSLLSDAISHSILPGIVIAFFVSKNLDSPLLFVGAAASGVLTVWLIELLARSRRISEDSAIGLVFPGLFSIGVVLISYYAGNVHIDVDAVLLGELVFSPLVRFEVLGQDLGPRALYVMGGILALNAALILAFYKELKLTTFDPALALGMGISPVLLQAGLTTMVSVTAVGAFDAVGSVLVVALMIVPPAAACLLADRLSRVIFWSLGIAGFSAVAGYATAVYFDASIAGSMATLCGVVFCTVWMFAPRRGILSRLTQRRRQREEFSLTMMLIHLLHHEGRTEARVECRRGDLHKHLNWDRGRVADCVERAMEEGLVRPGEGDLLDLTDEGRRRAKEAMVELIGRTEPTSQTQLA